MAHRVPLLLRCAAAVSLLAAGCSGADAPTASPPGATTQVAGTVTLNGAKLNVAIAATRAARERGLMGVTSLATDSGMLFVFADDRQRGFWMKDTPIPLSIAFLDANKRVIYLADMPPFSTIIYGGFDAPPMRYALEVNEGWFAAHSILPGMYATFSLPSGLVIEPDP